MTSDWRGEWAAVAAQVGQELDGPEPQAAAGEVHAETIRRYLEPLEFDCPLHYDRGVAMAHGHADIVAPYTSVTSLALPPLWRPGQTQFVEAGRDAQPAETNVRPFVPKGAPAVAGYFATNVDMEFVRPPIVGDRLMRKNPRLLACEPKETKVGRGAFLTLESEIVDAAGDRVATVLSTVYMYEPRGCHAA